MSSSDTAAAAVKGSGGHESNGVDDDKLVSVTINTTTVQLPKKTTGAAIRAAGKVPADEKIYLVGKHGDEEVLDKDVVHLKEGDRFESSPDGGVS